MFGARARAGGIQGRSKASAAEAREARQKRGTRSLTRRREKDSNEAASKGTRGQSLLACLLVSRVSTLSPCVSLQSLASPVQPYTAYRHVAQNKMHGVVMEDDGSGSIAPVNQALAYHPHLTSGGLPPSPPSVCGCACVHVLPVLVWYRCLFARGIPAAHYHTVPHMTTEQRYKGYRGE